jgi:two-component system sensor histidine kinase BaeS
VSDLLDLARMSQSSFSIREEPVELAAVVREVVQRHAARAEDLGVRLAAVSSLAGSVRGDEDRLVQAVSNLVENALRCVPRGGVVTVKATAAEVIVEDEGPGLLAEDLPHAFERFYLHNRSKSDLSVGSGLGLAIVKELVERMGGTVSVRSEIGQGTAFTVSLPPASGDAAEVAG